MGFSSFPFWMWIFVVQVLQWQFSVCTEVDGEKPFQWTLLWALLSLFERAAAHNWQIWQCLRLNLILFFPRQVQKCNPKNLFSQFFTEWYLASVWATREKSRRNWRGACDLKWNNLIYNTFGKQQLCVHGAGFFPFAISIELIVSCILVVNLRQGAKTAPSWALPLQRKNFCWIVVWSCGAQVKRRPSNFLVLSSWAGYC